MAVRVGVLVGAPDGTGTLAATLAPERNLAVDPRLLLGPEFAVVAAPGVPSGLSMGILTDTFIRPATVLPQVPITALPQRLLAVSQAAIARFDRDGDGIVSAADAAAVSGLFLTPAQFNRVAVTVEPAARTTPLLVPTDQNVVLVCLQPAAVGSR